MTSPNAGGVPVYQEMDQAGLSGRSRFKFHCHPGLPCFNRCCRVPTIILSPYDILRLKNFLGITSGEFLRRYTRLETEARSGFPLVFLDAFREAAPGCPFLGDRGCRVYPQRPAACRLFPITMGSQLTEEGVVDHYFCRRLDYCRGFDSQEEWTLEAWVANQGFAEYHRGRQAWLEIFVTAGFRGGAGPEMPAPALVAALAYDLDRLRSLLAEPAFRQAAGIEARELTTAPLDDTALLDWSSRLLKSLLEAPHPPEVLAELAVLVGDPGEA